MAHSSNHWRKLFSVYAKFLYALGRQPDWPVRWQDYRDQCLLQAGSGTALLFTPPVLDGKRVHIVAGKTWAARLSLPALNWLDKHFAINIDRKVIVSPYLDYRQLSNERIARLAQLVRGLGSASP